MSIETSYAHFYTTPRPTFPLEPVRARGTRQLNIAGTEQILPQQMRCDSSSKRTPCVLRRLLPLALAVRSASAASTSASASSRSSSASTNLVIAAARISFRHASAATMPGLNGLCSPPSASTCTVPPATATALPAPPSCSDLWCLGLLGNRTSMLGCVPAVAAASAPSCALALAFALASCVAAAAVAGFDGVSGVAGASSFGGAIACQSGKGLRSRHGWRIRPTGRTSGTARHMSRG